MNKDRITDIFKHCVCPECGGHLYPHSHFPDTLCCDCDKFFVCNRVRDIRGRHDDIKVDLYLVPQE